MEPFGPTVLDWGLLALVVFPLAQLPLVFYLARYVDVSDECTLDHAVEFRGVAPNDGPEDALMGSEPDRASGRTSDSRSPDARTITRPPSPSKLACPACGVENDPEFTFCRCCVARLSRSRRVVAPTRRTPPQ